MLLPTVITVPTTSKYSMICRENELDADAEYDVDGGLDMYESRKKKGTKVGPLTQNSC